MIKIIREFIEDKKWTVGDSEVVDAWRLNQFLDDLEKKSGEKCLFCRASLKEYWHKMTPGLVRTLVKVYSTVSKKGQNMIDKRELNDRLSHSEYGNFQKLRFHGLIAKYKQNGEWKRGSWLITKRGADFLKGQIEVPARVKTFRNRVIDHDEELSSLAEVMKKYPDFEVDFEFDLFNPQQKLI